jgi:uncharacterized protein
LTYIRQQLILKGYNNKPISADMGYIENGFKKPIIIFCHGFKGFKDWGHYNLVMDYFIQNNFCFIKFNFSHNGMSPNSDNSIFDDLDSFADNNLSVELHDLNEVIGWASAKGLPEIESDTNSIFLIGHSRGGAIAIIKSAEDSRIRKLVTWAAVADLERTFQHVDLNLWEREGVLKILNSRTGQEMPLGFQLCQDYYVNRDRFDIIKAMKKLEIPILLIHGSSDETVPVDDLINLSGANPNAQIKLLQGENHTFGVSHPFQEVVIPAGAQVVLNSTLQFFSQTEH